jgi:hypothetical protein
MGDIGEFSATAMLISRQFAGFSHQNQKLSGFNSQNITHERASPVLNPASEGCFKKNPYGGGGMN